MATRENIETCTTTFCVLVEALNGTIAQRYPVVASLHKFHCLEPFFVGCIHAPEHCSLESRLMQNTCPFDSAGRQSHAFVQFFVLVWMVVGVVALVPACVISAETRPVSCQRGSHVLFDDVAYCLFCLQDTSCPIEAPHRIFIDQGVVCATRPIPAVQVPLVVTSMLENRCAFAQDAGFAMSTPDLESPHAVAVQE